MDGWMGWREGGRDGMEGWVDGRKIGGYVNRWVGEWDMDGWRARRIDGGFGRG